MSTCSEKIACEGLAPQTPVTIANKVGLPTLVRRVGTHRRFKGSMLARIALSSGILESFDARTDDDWTIAYLDATSAALDVLTFYNERITNEAYRRTYTERRSGVELSRLVGYLPRPGVAASTVLSFLLEETPGAPEASAIPAGFRVQSTPGQGEKPQTFETSVGLVARRGYGAIHPRGSVPQVLEDTTTKLYLEGASNPPKTGDGLLFRGTNQFVFGVVSSVSAAADGSMTTVVIGAVQTFPVVADLLVPPTSPLDGTSAQSYQGGPAITQATLGAIASDLKLDLNELFQFLNSPLPGQPPNPAPNVRLKTFADAPSASVYVFRARSGLFGSGALDYNELPNVQRIGEAFIDKASTTALTFYAGPYAGATKWADTAYAADILSGNGLPLDSVQPGFAAGTPVILVGGTYIGLYRISANSEVSKRQFGITARVSRITLNSINGLTGYPIRTTAAYGAPELLPLARVSPAVEMPSNDLYLEGFFRYLQPGGWISVEGPTVDEPTIVRADAVSITEVSYVFPGAMQQGGTKVKLSRSLAYRFLTAETRINANVAPATHGETVEEILGAGDGRLAFQRFGLRQPPVTYVGDSGESGAASTLNTYVAGVRWKEVRSLSNQDANAKVYVTQLDDSGARTVMFGDGKNGARLPSGQENIRARYRRGLGSAGNLLKGQVNVALSRPPGLKEVRNPLPATGGDDPDSAEAIRRNLPLGLTTLGRVVSLSDYGDYSLAFSGVAKARADWAWTGTKREILISVCGPEARAIPPNSDLAQRLLKALRSAGDPATPIRIGAVTLLTFGISGTVKVDPDYRIEDVRANVELVLRTKLSFDFRDLGQPVFPSEVVAWIQALPGVLYVDLDALTPKTGSTTADGAILPAVPGTLILLDPAPLALEVTQ